MNIETIKAILNNRLVTLQQLMNNYYSTGNLEEYAKAEIEFLETKQTLEQLG